MSLHDLASSGSICPQPFISKTITHSIAPLGPGVSLSQKRVLPDPDSLRSRLKRLFIFDQAECEGLPLICIGPLAGEISKR